MDDQGYRARRRAAHTEAYYQTPQRGPDGRWIPVESVQPLNEPFVGGFQPDRVVPVHNGEGVIQMPEGAGQSMGYVEHAYRPPMDVDPMLIPGPTAWEGKDQGATTHPGPPVGALLDQGESYTKSGAMHPHLQFMCGPLLRYDTVDENHVWRGACMIVTADAGSQYEPNPILTLEWDPQRPVHADSSSTAQLGPFGRVSHIPGQEIFVYHGIGGTFTFWRFLMEVPLATNEMGARYRINGGQEIEFFVPGINQNMRWAAHSCNGFSAGVNPDDFKGPGFASGFDPLWEDLLDKHIEKPFHVLVGGGDQIYCDSLTLEPELHDWVKLKTQKEKLNYVITDDIKFAIDRFYFSHYCLVFRNGAFAKANSSIPMMNMLDDHDLIDGFGSYPDDLQTSPVFNTIGSRGYFWFLLFQLFVVDEVDGLSSKVGEHTFKSTIIGGDGPFIPSAGHSMLTYLGPQVHMLLLDCRAERMKKQICSATTYERIFRQLEALPPGVEHLVIQVGIPIAYPRMNFLERALDSKMNPLVILGKAGTMTPGMSGFLNKFNKDAELLDDLSDHWTAGDHKKERNWFVGQCQRLALGRKMRISFLSGDVHCAAVGCFKTYQKSRFGTQLQPATDHRYMINVVTSAIVNTPPPPPVIAMVGMLADKTHRTMHDVQTDECMLPIFANDTNGKVNKNKFIMGRRNWTQVDYDGQTKELVYDIRVEKEKGIGTTVGFVVRSPPPKWK